ncbi:amino acid ABC transporter [Photobacterium sagamiensis]|uniref:substrate-binding periplasmic protein n=1 Tax=Photobacterium sagamiensis TaxID=2910241 RepID=UPI003D09F7B7
MKKKLSLIVSLTLSCVSFYSNSKTINYYVIAKQATPFQIEEDNEKHRGIVTDIVKAIFVNSQHEIDYHTYPFNRMITLLKSGGKPNWITYGSPGWGGVQAENLSDIPIYNVKHLLVSSSKKAFYFNTMDDLNDKIIVLLHGFDYPQLSPYLIYGYVEELRVKDYTAAFRVINKIPGDTAFVEMESRVKYNFEQQGLDSSNYHMQSFSSVIPNYPIYLAFDPKMDKDVQKFINERLKTLKHSGGIDSIINKYL